MCEACEECPACERENLENRFGKRSPGAKETPPVKGSVYDEHRKEAIENPAGELAQQQQQSEHMAGSDQITINGRVYIPFNQNERVNDDFPSSAVVDQTPTSSNSAPVMDFVMPPSGVVPSMQQSPW